MTDFQRCQQAATDPACPEKGVVLQLTPRHMALIREAQQALYRATKQDSAERGAALADWQAASERLSVALVSRLEAIEEARDD